MRGKMDIPWRSPSRRQKAGAGLAQTAIVVPRFRGKLLEAAMDQRHLAPRFMPPSTAAYKYPVNSPDRVRKKIESKAPPLLELLL